MTRGNRKRWQHFVWRHYLTAWAIDGHVSCLHEGRMFPAAPRSIGAEQDFYRLQELTADDMRVIKFLSQRADPRLQRSHSAWFTTFNIAFVTRRIYEAIGVENASMEHAIDESIQSVEEDLHTDIERSALPYLRALLDGDASFFNSLVGYSDFLRFVSTQAFRTRAMQAKMIEAFDPDGLLKQRFPGFSPERCWRILRHPFALNVTSSLVGDRAAWWIAVLRSPDQELITGDQPVINLFAYEAGVAGSAVPEHLRYYYPISPRRAVVVGCLRESARPANTDLTAEEAMRLNGYIARASEKQLYAASRETLLPFQANARRVLSSSYGHAIEAANERTAEAIK